ncbi:hypothetical protein FVEG_14637 [Fusarium verticillioides 7600]|uniref:Uncharacterized protein n=1 Tax=Gibberella moniliformis (strain M3125 / FGSC 7600) TaxID=334819 RepID=W7LL93_GIBM7|nr:hypothetical protein FVEG_14637 [Fusarium verticillioides 7600]EWG36214.1 hypothetical protein FVEG_14637 [Fusarium verticillioides 7600]
MSVLFCPSFNTFVITDPFLHVTRLIHHVAMSKEEQSSSSSQTTPLGPSSGYVSPPPYESPVLSREPTPESVHVIVDPLEMPFGTMPEEAKPRRFLSSSCFPS